MKQLKFFLLSGVFIAGFTLLSAAQETILPEVTVLARNYKYIKAVESKETAQPVKLLERQAAAYDIKNSEYYNDEYDNYFITFYLPSGYVLAVYNQDGKLLHTAEKFKNVALPADVTKAVGKRYPNWAISNDVYRVNYEDEGGAKMIYKLVLENGSKRLRVKANEKGEFSD